MFAKQQVSRRTIHTHCVSQSLPFTTEDEWEASALYCKVNCYEDKGRSAVHKNRAMGAIDPFISDNTPEIATSKGTTLHKCFMLICNGYLASR